VAVSVNRRGVGSAGRRAMATRSWRFGVVGGLLTLLLTSMGVSGAATTSAPATRSVQAFMTLYGYVDNSPPGPIIAHPCIHSSAGGIGTFANPVTFATDVHELAWCKIIYVPYMERYFIHEDECSECDTDWSRRHLYRFDMWAGGDSASLHQPERRALLQCEDAWTRANSVTDPDNPTVIVNPPSNLPVTTDPIFAPPTTCWQPITVTNPGSQLTTWPATLVRLQISATDSSPNRSLQYGATGLPVGLSIDSQSGLITGTPTVRQDRRVTVTAADAYNSVSIQFRWTFGSTHRASVG
jgi:hypothetical protein